jgi:flagellar biosynthesis/type III secretory pathway M-ring protein FliF/YscJ
MMEGAMEIVFWVIVAIIVFAIVYIGALNLRKRKEALERQPATSDAAPGTKEHGVDLQARRKTYDDIT